MSQLFNKIKVATANRSTFDLSHHQVTTSDFGYILPICYRDMLPNDDFVVKPSIFCRLAPMVVPTYGRIKCSIFHFFVPYRLLYGHWDQFITQDPNNHTVPPYMTRGDIYYTLLQDPAFDIAGTSERGFYTRVMSNLGLNPELFKLDRSDGGLDNDERFSMFPFLALYRIYIDYFLDTSIGDHPREVEVFNELIKDGGNLFNVDGSQARFMLAQKFAAYKKDYFTTAKINPQSGSASKVGVDLATDLNPGFVHNPSSNNNDYMSVVDGKVGYLPAGAQSQQPLPSGSNSTIGQFTIEALRAASSLQRYLERNNFVGTKVINRLLAHFGVQPTAERLDMAEYIGGNSFNIQIGDVTSHSVHNLDPEDNISTVGLGFQAGKGVGSGQDSVRYHAKEHGVFMSCMVIQPDTGYYQGISRFWSKGVYGDALDYFHPEFENLGYQEILNKEVFVPSELRYNTFDPDGVFGYTPRFSEYKFQNDVLGGDFVSLNARSEQARVQPLDSWHLFRKLNYDASHPLSLNLNFVQLHNSTTDYDRIFQFQDNGFDHFYFNIDVDVKATRDMSGFGEPSLEATNEADGKTINLPYGGTRL